MHGETVVWAVPVPQLRKEDAPSDPAARQIECPRITATGPGGIVEPGGVAEFTAAIDGNVPEGIKLKWTVTDGTIIEGEEDYTLRVLTPKNEYRIAATLRVEGLDKRCANRATEVHQFWNEPEAILLEEFSASVSEIPRDELKRAVDEHREYPTNQIFIIEYFPVSTSEFSINEKIRRMKDYMSRELEFDTSSVTIVIAELDEPLTKIFRIPPGADDPTP